MESNTFEYRIYQNVYDEMISGRKNIEIRLLNDKSEKIKINDIIKFQVLNSDKYLLVTVNNKYIFNNIDDLWSNRDTVLKSSMNLAKEEFTDAMYEIFGKDNVLNSKLVGIEFKLN
jgi:ASC-1-like (ASCH) protein